VSLTFDPLTLNFSTSLCQTLYDICLCFTNQLIPTTASCRAYSVSALLSWHQCISDNCQFFDCWKLRYHPWIPDNAKNFCDVCLSYCQRISAWTELVIIVVAFKHKYSSAFACNVLNNVSVSILNVLVSVSDTSLSPDKVLNTFIYRSQHYYIVIHINYKLIKMSQFLVHRVHRNHRQQ